jgi:hypothetical protein
LANAAKTRGRHDRDRASPCCDKRKAQLFSTDLAISFSVVIVVIIITSLLWTYALERKALYHEIDEMRQLSRDVSNALLLTPGTPPDWTDAATAQSIGLTNEPYVLDSAKITRLANAQQNDTLNALGIIGPGYGMNLTIAMWTGAQYTTYYSMGSERANATDISIARRHALLNGSWALVTLKVWR